MKLTNHQLCQAKDYKSRLGFQGWFIWLCNNLAVDASILQVSDVVSRVSPVRNIDHKIQHYADQIRKSKYYRPKSIKPQTRRKHK